MTMSPAAIDRALKGGRKKLTVKGISSAKLGKRLKNYSFMRTRYPWDERKPVFSRFTPSSTPETGARGSFVAPLPPLMPPPAGRGL
jgi:hypothetical protein